MYRIKGDYDKAIADYTETICFRPEYAEAFSGRGLVYEMRGDLDKAIADYTEAIRLKPDYPEAYCSRGTAYGEQGPARPNACRLYRGHPAQTRLRRGLPQTWLRLRNMATTTKRWLTSARSSDSHQMTPEHTATVGCPTTKGDHDAAIADFSEAIRMKPDYAEGIP